MDAVGTASTNPATRDGESEIEAVNADGCTRDYVRQQKPRENFDGPISRTPNGKFRRETQSLGRYLYFHGRTLIRAAMEVQTNHFVREANTMENEVNNIVLFAQTLFKLAVNTGLIAFLVLGGIKMLYTLYSSNK